MDGTAGPGLDDIGRCFGGAIPAVLGTASADGVPNVTFLSRALRVDEERIALSNQFMSKTARNIAVSPRASLLLLDPLTHDEFRLSLVYERTDRRGPVFDRLRDDIEALAALEGMQDVYRLRAADIYRVLEIEQMEPNLRVACPRSWSRPAPPHRSSWHWATSPRAPCLRIGPGGPVETPSRSASAPEFGYGHTTFLVLDEEGQALFTIASRGFKPRASGGSGRRRGPDQDGRRPLPGPARRGADPVPSTPGRFGVAARAACAPVVRCRCQGSGASRAASRCLQWRWASSWAYSSRRAGNRSRSATRTSSCSR
ncbi:MAG: pyridoxamine 5'-phosphate oxidase family protein [Microthrixaceae bacterium]